MTSPSPGYTRRIQQGKQEKHEAPIHLSVILSVLKSNCSFPQNSIILSNITVTHSRLMMPELKAQNNHQCSGISSFTTYGCLKTKLPTEST